MPVVPTTTPVITVGNIIEETRRHMLGSHRAELNRLTGSLNNSDTTFTVDFDLQGITRGSFVAIDDELAYVWAVTPSTKTISSCERGQEGTTAAAHSAGAIIEVNPRFPRSSIRWALKEELRSWGPRLYQVLSKTISVASATRGYDLTTLGEFQQILEVRRSNSVNSGETNPQSWPRLTSWQVIRNGPTGSFSSGNALVIPDTFNSPLPTLNVVYAAPFDVDTAFTDATDLIDDVGLSPSMADIAPLGAAWRLLSTREIKRTFTEGQGEPADLKNVPPDYIGRAAARLKSIRDSRIDDEILKLRSRYPMAGWG